LPLATGEGGAPIDPDNVPGQVHKIYYKDPKKDRPKKVDLK